VDRTITIPAKVTRIMMNLMEGFMNPESPHGEPLDGRKSWHICKKATPSIIEWKRFTSTIKAK
jgi:hypothetical protein